MLEVFLETLQGKIWHDVADVILIGLCNGLRIIHPRLESAWLPRLGEYLHLEQTKMRTQYRNITYAYKMFPDANDP